VFHQIMVGIYFLQAMLLAVLAVKRFPYALFVLPLVVFTVIFHIVQSSQFKRPWRLGNAREAAMLDARERVRASSFLGVLRMQGGGVLDVATAEARQVVGWVRTFVLPLAAFTATHTHRSTPLQLAS
jgi:hypothetical protein